MSQVLQTNGDYRIKTALGGNIVLDTGPNIGRVVVTGDFVVEGNTVNVEVANLAVEDNIITVNAGETGNGVTLGYAGIEVDRGTEDNASLIFDESINTWIIARGQNGSYSFSDNSSLKLRSLIITDPTDDTSTDISITNVSDTGAGVEGVLRINGIPEYEDNVLDDNDIPNKRYVDRSIIEKPTFQIVKIDSRVTVEDISDPQRDSLLLESRVSTVVDSNVMLTAYNNRVEIQNLRFFTNVIENPSTNENIQLKTSGTGRVEFDFAAQFNHTGAVPATVPVATVIYGDEPSPEGGSGVYFVNEQVNGELISKRKALTFSIIF
jgi:hypothetical protein